MLQGFYLLVAMLVAVFVFFGTATYLFDRYKERKAKKNVKADSDNDVTSLDDYKYMYRNIKDE